MRSNSMRMNTSSYRAHAAGFSLIEAIIATALCLSVFLGVASAFTLTVKSALNNTARIQAIFLGQEGQEVVRLLRDSSWTTQIASRTVGTPFYLSFNGGAWSATTTNTYVDSFFERTVVADAVYRDTAKNIVGSGGTLDPDTKKITVTVSWRESGATTSVSLITYLTNLFKN